MTARRVVLALLPIPVAAVLVAATSARSDADSEQLIRSANAAFARKDHGEADRLYESAEVLTADPGLVAFNRAAVLFENGNYPEAAAYYFRVLRDAACPPDRAARARYNLGTCLIHQPNATSAVYARAVNYLRDCYDSNTADADPVLKANARHNLKLAKLLWKNAWDEEEKSGKEPPTPNDPLPPEEEPWNDPRQMPLGTDPQLGEPQGGDGSDTGEMPQTRPQYVPGAGVKAVPTQSQAPAPGATGQLQPLEDRREIQPLTPEQTREQLRRTAERLRRDQRILRQTLYGQERTGVHDW